MGLQTRINSRFSKKLEGLDDFRDVNINDFIAELTYLQNYGKRIDYLSEEEEDSKRISMYAYLRDKEGTQSVGEAIDRIGCGKVPQKVIEFWVSERYFGKWEYDAIKEGYPEVELPDIDSIHMPREEFEEIMAELWGLIMLAELELEGE